MIGRPKKWPKGWKLSSLMIYERYSEVYEKSRELAEREGITFSELVVRSLGEYIEGHYPGNPQIPLDSFVESGLKPVRLEVKIASRRTKWYLEKLGNPRVGEQFKRDIRRKELPSLLVKLAKLNRRLRDEEVSELVDRGEMECFGEGYS